MTLDKMRARLAELTTELAAESDPERRRALDREREALREQARDLFARHPEGRAMLEQELASLERRLAELEAGQIKKAKISLGGGSPSGGGHEPSDIQFMRSVHERWNDVPSIRERIAQIRKRLE